MSVISDFNRIEDCDKIDANCVNAYTDFHLDEENPAGLCLGTSWGGDCLDLTSIVKSAETLTTLYLSPESDPNCLVYVPERGDNVCIKGNDLSRIISMRYLKDVSQDTAPSDGIVYMYDNTTKLFEPYDLKTTVSNINTAIQNANQNIANLKTAVANLNTAVEEIKQTLADHESRLDTVEEKLTPPTGTPANAKVAFGTINIYGDYGAVVNDDGTVSSLDKTHGLYTHNLNNNALDDQIMG